MRFRLNLMVLWCIVVLVVGVGVRGVGIGAEQAPNNQLELTGLERVSVGTGGAESNGQSYTPNESADGRYVVFASYADNWYPENNSNTGCFSEDESVNRRCLDIFRRDRENGTTIKLTNGVDGQTGNRRSAEPVISRDGNTVFFFSWASNLVNGDTNRPELEPEAGIDTFRYVNGGVERISLQANGGQIDGKSVGTGTANGQFALYSSTGNVMSGVDIREGAENLYVRDLSTGAIDFVSPTYSGSEPNDVFASGVNADDSGRYIVFSTFADNILPNDDNGHNDVFLFDRETRVMKLVSRAADGGYPNNASGKSVVSPDGTFVAFHSEASDIVSNDTNGVVDVFLYNIATEAIERVSVDENGGQGNGKSKEPTVCNGARLIGFFSEASNLVDGDNNNTRDGFIKDMETGELTVVTRSESGEWGNDIAHKVVMSANCDGVLFASDASNLVPNDNNGVRDIFRWDVTLEQPAAFNTSALSIRPTANMTETFDVTLTIRNSGDEAGTTSAVINLPTNVAIDLGSISSNMSVSNGNRVSIGNVTVDGGEAAVYRFQVSLLDADAGDIITIPVNGTVFVSGAGQEQVAAVAIINGYELFLPFVNNQHNNVAKATLR